MNPRLRRLPLLTLASLSPLATATPSLVQLGDLAISCSGRGNGSPQNGVALQDSFVAGQVKCKEAQVLPGTVAKAKSQYLGAGGGSASGGSKAVFGKAGTHSAGTIRDGELALSLGGFADRWTITIPGVPPNTALVLSVRARVQGDLEAHGDSGGASLSAAFFRDGGLSGSTSWGIRSDITHQHVFASVDGMATAEINVATGLPFWLGTTLTSAVGSPAQGGQGSGASSTPAAGLVWDGVTGLRDYWTGQVYTDWSLTSDSGVDWRLPCPCHLP